MPKVLINTYEFLKLLKMLTLMTNVKLIPNQSSLFFQLTIAPLTISSLQLTIILSENELIYN